jgi:hypothetical protein
LPQKKAEKERVPSSKPARDGQEKLECDRAGREKPQQSYSGSGEGQEREVGKHGLHSIKYSYSFRTI